MKPLKITFVNRPNQERFWRAWAELNLEPGCKFIGFVNTNERKEQNELHKNGNGAVND